MKLFDVVSERLVNFSFSCVCGVCIFVKHLTDSWLHRLFTEWYVLEDRGNQFHIEFITVNCTIFVSELKLTDFTEFWLNKLSNSAFEWFPHLRQESHISCALCGRFHEDWRAAVSVASLSRLSYNWWKRIEGVCSLSLLKLSSYSLSLYHVSIVIPQNLSLCSAKFQHTEYPT